MGSYNNDNLFNPSTLDEIIELLYTRYNEYLETLETSLTFEQFKQTNIYFLFVQVAQLLYNNDLQVGLLYDKLIQYLKDKKELENQPKGSTFTGLYNSLLELKDDTGTPIVDIINIGEINAYPNNFAPGQVGIALKYLDSEANKQLIADTIIYNLAAGIETVNSNGVGTDVIQNSTIQNGQQFPIKWVVMEEVALKVKIYYKVNNNFNGQLPTAEEILNIYFNRFTDVRLYQPGKDLLPGSLNNTQFFNSENSISLQESTPALAYIDTQFSIDDGVNYLPRNNIIAGEYNKYYIIQNKIVDIEVIQE